MGGAHHNWRNTFILVSGAPAWFLGRAADSSSPARPFSCFACAGPGRDTASGPAAVITPLLGRRVVFVPWASLDPCRGDGPKCAWTGLETSATMRPQEGPTDSGGGVGPFFVLPSAPVLLASVVGRGAL